jgi:hypothetical protein
MDGFMMFMEDIVNKFNYEAGDEKVPYMPRRTQVSMHPALGNPTIPLLGQYGDVYRWMTPCMALRCFPQSNEQLRSYIYNLLPTSFVEMQDGDGNTGQKQFLTDKATEYWIINYDAQDFCKEKLEEYGDKSILARVNLSPHAFLYPSAQMG